MKKITTRTDHNILWRIIHFIARLLSQFKAFFSTTTSHDSKHSAHNDNNDPISEKTATTNDPITVNTEQRPSQLVQKPSLLTQYSLLYDSIQQQQQSPPSSISPTELKIDQNPLLHREQQQQRSPPPPPEEQQQAPPIVQLGIVPNPCMNDGYDSPIDYDSDPWYGDGMGGHVGSKWRSMRLKKHFTVQTSLLLKEAETAYVGAFAVSSELRTIKKSPLSFLPWMNELFSRTEFMLIKSAILVFITARSIYPQQQQQQRQLQHQQQQRYPVIARSTESLPPSQ